MSFLRRAKTDQETDLRKKSLGMGRQASIKHGLLRLKKINKWIRTSKTNMVMMTLPILMDTTRWINTSTMEMRIWNLI